jgi:SAM-dependent methyltransferase
VYSDWTTTFFGGLAVEFWVRVAPAPAPAEIDFLKSIFGESNELLDVACGAGRYTIPLGAAGYRMTGVDLSADFLNIARQNAPDIDWEQRDIRELEWRERFGGALCFGNSFGYFDRAGTMQLLHGVARALRPGSFFVLETAVTAESLLPTLQPSRRMELADIVFSSTSVYVPADGRLDISYTFERNDLRESKEAHSWIFLARDVVAMLREAGFDRVDIYSSHDRSPFVLGSPRALFVAKRSDKIAAFNKQEEA